MRKALTTFLINSESIGVLSDATGMVVGAKASRRRGEASRRSGDLISECMRDYILTMDYSAATRRMSRVTNSRFTKKLAERSHLMSCTGISAGVECAFSGKSVLITLFLTTFWLSTQCDANCAGDDWKEVTDGPEKGGNACATGDVISPVFLNDCRGAINCTKICNLRSHRPTRSCSFMNPPLSTTPSTHKHNFSFTFRGADHSIPFL